jgi:Cof subfamily protein (haloacid dehalogenase superfamily)
MSRCRNELPLVTAPIRLLVSDVDGTLVDKEKHLTAATADAVRRLEEAGVGFTVISARPRSGVMPIADTLGIDAPIAAFNGGLIFRRDGTVDEHHVLPREAVEQALTLAEGEPVDTWFFADDQWFASADRGVHAEHERVAANQEPVVTTDFAPLAERVDKITFVSDDPPVLAALMARCKEAFGSLATIAQSQTYYLDITALQANKGDGLVALAAAFQVPLDATAAIGDQFNDVPMLERAGLSVAMGNAPDGVKAIAAHQTRANDQDGVAHAIDTIILPRKGESE